MKNEGLNEVVERLLADRRFQRRFRKDPERAVRGYGLTSVELDAVKRGDERTLIGLGVSPDLVWPELAARNGVVWGWLLHPGRKLAPAAFVAALLVAFPAQAATGRRASGGRYVRRRAARRAAGRHLRRASARRAAYPDSRRRLARARARALKRA
jgi:hypothetical protein